MPTAKPPEFPSLIMPRLPRQLGEERRLADGSCLELYECLPAQRGVTAAAVIKPLRACAWLAVAALRRWT
jgi:hypothetical protein